MAISSDEALTQLDFQSHIFRVCHQRLNEDWQPDVPPLSLVMSAYARELVASVDVLTEKEKRSTFSTLEVFLSQADDAVKDAVATCFLEALLGAASAGSLKFEKISGFLGPRSRLYCHDWDKASGVKTPGLEA